MSLHIGTQVNRLTARRLEHPPNTTRNQMAGSHICNACSKQLLSQLSSMKATWRSVLPHSINIPLLLHLFLCVQVLVVVDAPN